MKSLSSKIPGQPHPNNRGQIIRSCLPIAGTAILVFIVSGGFPPTTWKYLFHTLSELNPLFVSQGPGVILPLTILIVQSLFLAIAWGLLVWVILREGAYLMTLQSKAELDRLLAFQSSDGSSLDPSQMLAKNLPKKDFDVGLDTSEEQYLGMTTSQLEDPDFDIATGQLEELDLNVTTASRLREANTTASLRREKNVNVTTAPLRRDANTTTASLRREKSVHVTTAPLRRAANTTTSSLRREKSVHVTTAPLRRDANTTTSSLRREKSVHVTTGQLGVTTSPLRGETEEVSRKARSNPSHSAQSPNVPSQSVKLSNVPSHSMQLANVTSRSVQLSPNVPSRNIQSRSVQLPSVESHKGKPSSIPSRNVQPLSVESHSTRLPSLESHDGQSRNGQSRNVQPSRMSSRNVQSRNGQSGSVQSRNGQPGSVQSNRSLRHGLTARSLGEEDLIENPFDQKVPSSSKVTFDPKRSRADEVVDEKGLDEEELDEEEEDEDDDDNPFVYGNPFDGPLPEVFRYDADLRRSVPELAAEEEAQSKNAKAKGKSEKQKDKRSSR